MVNELANRNKPPKSIRRPFRSLALFPEGYDWDEQKRVHIALDRLHGDTRKELWEELINTTEDAKYSLTIIDEAESAHNRTVGYFCQELAYSRLVAVFRRHLVADPDKDGPSVYVDVDVSPLSVAKWRKKRADKQLYELQIEVCEKALAQLPLLERVSPDQIDLMRKEIELEIVKLRKTKTPVILDSNAKGIETYFKETAQAAREEIEVTE